MRHLRGTVSGPRPGRMRERRGRGRRGPLALPGPLSPGSVPVHRTPGERFDLLVAGVLRALERHFEAESIAVDVVVEDVPLLPTSWTEPVPHGAVVQDGDATRLVLYRVPLTRRASSAEDLEDLVWSAVLTHLARIWDLDPEDLDPRR